jgi:Protein phosphatase 2C
MVFQLAGASIPGSDHTMPGQPTWKNCQDAHFFATKGNVFVGLVADGCGSGTFSEVGAQLGAKFLGERLIALAARSVSQGHNNFTRWPELRSFLLGTISLLAAQMGESLSDAVREYFLFSFVGFLVLPERTYVFHCGDGMYAVNGEVTKLGPFDKNEPPYLAYGIADTDDSRSRIIVSEFLTSDVTSLCVASDGIDYYPDFSAVTIATWISQNVVFTNSDILRRRLAVLNCEKVVDGRLIGGPLKDDTSVVLARRTL